MLPRECGCAQPTPSTAQEQQLEKKRAVLGINSQLEQVQEERGSVVVRNVPWGFPVRNKGVGE